MYARSVYEQMLNGIACKFNQGSCNAYMLGSFTIAANKIQMHFNPSTRSAELGDEAASISKLSSLLKGISIESSISDDYRRKHRGCYNLQELKNDVERVLDSIPDVLQDHHIEHMKTQAKKLGKTQTTVAASSGGPISLQPVDFSDFSGSSDSDLALPYP